MRGWADLPLRLKGLVVVSVPLLPLVVTALLAYSSQQHELEAEEDVTKALELRLELDATMQVLVEAETATRGYLLTGRDEFLAPYRLARETLPLHLGRLTTLIEPHQAERMQRITRAASERLASLEQLIQAAPPGSTPTPSVESLLAGRALMSRVRDEFAALRAEEDRLLQLRRGTSRQAHARELAIVLGGAAFGVIAGVLAAVLFTRGIASRMDALGTVADRLGARAEALTGPAAALPFPTGRDEIGRLAERLRDAAERLRREERARRDADDALRRTAMEVRELNARLEEQVAQQQVLNRELESFSYSVSHDLRAPLRHIVGFTSLLEEHIRASLDEEGRRLLSRISNAARRLAALIDDLLAFSRMGRMEMLARPVDLGDVVRQAQQEVAGDGAGRTIEWHIGPLPQVHGDADMLRLAFANLLSNAVKYSAPRDVARIDVGQQSADGHEAVVFVRDNGVGFDMKYVDKLFGVFQRLHSSADFEGTGIGLANVRRIVQRHGGRIWADAAVNEGATFYVALPLTTGRSGAA